MGIAHVRIVDVETVIGVTTVVEEIAMTVAVDVAHARKTAVEVEHVEETKTRTINARKPAVGVLLPKRKIEMTVPRKQRAQLLVRSRGAHRQRRKLRAHLLERNRGVHHQRRKQKAHLLERS